MVKKDILVNTDSGLQSKTAAMFIQKASNFSSSIWLEKAHIKANAKSLLGVLALKVGNGSSITLLAEGEDEQQAILDLENYLKSSSGDIE